MLTFAKYIYQVSLTACLALGIFTFTVCLGVRLTLHTYVHHM